MTLQVRKTAVLGAGVMGAQIAAHLANANVPVATKLSAFAPNCRVPEATRPLTNAPSRKTGPEI